MSGDLDLHDVQVILTSLKYSKRNIAESPDHASYEQKQANLREIEQVEVKVRSLRDALKEAKD
jgi:hypothetical protein